MRKSGEIDPASYVAIPHDRHRERPMIADMISDPRHEETEAPRPSPAHDPPDPAPQAAAWERALRVIFMESRHGAGGPTKSRAWNANKRGRAAIKGVRGH
jgi:hypothetical protein